MNDKIELDSITKVSINSNIKNGSYILEQFNNEVDIKEEHRHGFIAHLIKYWDKYVYTLCILVNYINFGITAGLEGPTTIDLKFMLKTTLVKLGYGTTFSSIGNLTGSFSGFLYKYINRQLSLLTMTIILAIFTALTPLSMNMWQYYICSFLSSLGAGGWDSGNSAWIIEMWGDRAPSVLHLQQLSYGLGSIVAPLLVSPYVLGDLSNKTTSAPESSTYSSVLNTTTISPNNTSDDDINYSVDRRPRLIIPYMIGGCLQLTVPIVLLVMFFIKRYKITEKQSLDKKTEESKIVIGVKPTEQPLELPPKTRKILITLFAISLMGYNGVETTFFIYADTFYQYLPIGISASKAAHMTSLFSTTYTVARGVSAIISSKVRADIMLSYHLVIIGMSLGILYLGQHSETMIYIGLSMIGIGFSAMWPSYFSYAAKTFKMTDRICSIFSVVSCLFMMVSPFVVAPFIEKHPEMLLNVELACLSFIVLIFIIILIIVKRSQRYPAIYTITNKQG